MSTSATSQDQIGNDPLKRFRFRKIYIELRIPRVKKEITAIATRKKAVKESGGEPSKDAIEEMIYNNQHLIELRKELQLLEQERKAVLKNLRDIRLQQTG